MTHVCVPNKVHLVEDKHGPGNPYTYGSGGSTTAGHPEGSTCPAGSIMLRALVNQRTDDSPFAQDSMRLRNWVYPVV